MKSMAAAQLKVYEALPINQSTDKLSPQARKNLCGNGSKQ
jgi:hypothetical protein